MGEPVLTVLMIKCPRCGRRTNYHDNPCRPFCCELCRQVDLGRWATEEYRIPAVTNYPGEEESTDGES